MSAEQQQGGHIVLSDFSDADQKIITAFLKSPCEIIDHIESLERRIAELEEDQEVFFTMPDGREICDDENALAVLLRDQVIFSNGRHYSFQGEPGGETTVLFVNANDVFMWACADGEDLPHKEIGPLYKMHQADKKWGAIKWVCKQRNMQPQAPIARDMRKDGAWDEMMEALPLNPDRKREKK